MAVKSERILLTGSNSFTGKALVQAFRQDGHEVVTVTRSAHDSDIVADLQNPDQIIDAVAQAKPSVIVHMAAMTFVPDQNLHRIYTTNVAGTASLLKGARACASSLRTVILAGAARIYAPPVSDEPIAEDHPIAPADHYAVSKFAMERMAQLFSRDLPITITRPFNYTGPGQDAKFVVPKLVAAYAAGEDVRVGNLNVARDFSSIDTIVEVYRRLVSAPQPGQTFNICSGQPIRLSEIATMLEEITGNHITLTVDPAFVRPDEPAVIVGSKKKLEAAIGELPAPRLRDTLAKMVAYARQQTA